MGFMCSLCFVSEQKKNNNGNNNNNEKKGDGGGAKNNDSAAEKKTASVTVVLKVDMHCEGCASRIVKCVRDFQGLIFDPKCFSISLSV